MLLQPQQYPLLTVSSSGELQAPRFITQPSASGSIVAVGRTKILQCQALGFPQPQYRWLKDGDFISGFSSEHFYKIQSVEREDAGSYQCIAKNSVGSILSEIIPLSVACKSFHISYHLTKRNTTITLIFSHDLLPRKLCWEGEGQAGPRRGVQFPQHHQRAVSQRVLANGRQLPVVWHQVRRHQGQQPCHTERGRDGREALQVIN